jgi:formate dehydrogenase subunit gamma
LGGAAIRSAPPANKNGCFNREDGMAKFVANLRLTAGTLALVFFVMLAAPAPVSAQVNPNASAVQEQQLMQQLKVIQGLGTIPDTKSYVLEHPAGREWREFHTVTLKWIGGIAILGMIALLAIFYLWRGSMKVRAGYSGVKILRFNGFERFVHWLTAVTFVILGITGLNITFGRALLLPWMGPEAFSTWSEWAKYSHNYLSFAFTIGVVLMFLMWVGQNFPTAADAEWVKMGGGMFDKEDKTHAPAWKFNAGQKILYWLVVLASAAMIISGFMLMFPFYGGLNVGNMELAEVFHGVVGMLFVSLICAHIYLGTLGMEGAFEAMSDGSVDLNWAKEHHNLWVEEEMKRGAVGARAQPAE